MQIIDVIVLACSKHKGQVEFPVLNGFYNSSILGLNQSVPYSLTFLLNEDNWMVL